MRNARRHREGGSVMVEFTISLTFLIPLFLGAWAFGYTFYQYSKLENAVRAGARYASLRTYDSSTSTPSTAWSGWASCLGSRAWAPICPAGTLEPCTSSGS